MKFIGTLLVVKDIKKAVKFYCDLFDLLVEKDNDGNVILSNGIILQEEKYWTKFIEKEVKYYNHATEIYFEEDNIEQFVIKLEELYPNVVYVNKLMTHSWGQKVIRFYDLDGNLIEVGTSF